MRPWSMRLPTRTCAIPPFVLGGASTPASTAGSLVQINAEALAGIAFSQRVRRLRPVAGDGFHEVRRALPHEHAGRPDGPPLPSVLALQRMYGVMTAGAGLVPSTTGYMEGALTRSYARFVLDAEQMEMFCRLGQGVDFGELEAALEAIGKVEAGGHFLGAKHTPDNFERAFMMPELMNHDGFEQWEAAWMRTGVPPPPLDEELRDFVARRERELPDDVR